MPDEPDPAPAAEPRVQIGWFVALFVLEIAAVATESSGSPIFPLLAFAGAACLIRCIVEVVRYRRRIRAAGNDGTPS